MARPAEYTLEEILESINTHKNVEKGCEALGTTRSNFYKRLDTESMELVKIPVYSIRRKQKKS